MPENDRGRSTDDNLHVLAAEIENVGRDIAEIKHLCKNVQQTQSLVSERLTRIEERYTNHAAALDRSFSALQAQDSRVKTIEVEQRLVLESLAAVKKHDERIKLLEVEQPLTKTVRGWALTIVGVILAIGGATFWNSSQTKPQQVIVVDRDGSTTRIEPPKR